MVFVVVLLYGTQGIGMALNKQYAQVLEHKPILRQVVRKAEEEARQKLEQLRLSKIQMVRGTTCVEGKKRFFKIACLLQSHYLFRKKRAKLRQKKYLACSS